MALTRFDGEFFSLALFGEIESRRRIEEAGGRVARQCLEQTARPRIQIDIGRAMFVTSFDDEKFESLVPQHPLSRLRRELRQIAESVRIE